MPDVILLIEDDARIRELLPRYLQREGMEVYTAADGASGLAAVTERNPALVLLDVNLPDLDGWSILRRLRQGAQQPAIIMLTGRSDVPDRLLGLDLGADDYIVKPFEPLEVVARIKAVLRRTRGARPVAETLEFPGLRVDLAGRAVERAGIPVNFTSKEFDLFSALARQPGRVLTRAQLYDIGWGDDAYADDHTLDVHVNRLRQKLAAADGISYIATVRGVGYKFEVRHGEA
jgi:two-component system response regulator ResD